MPPKPTDKFMGGAFDDFFFRAVAPSSHDLDLFFADSFCRFAAVSALKIALMEAGFTLDNVNKFIEAWREDQVSIMEERMAADPAVKKHIDRFAAMEKLQTLFKSRLNVFVKTQLKQFRNGFE